MGKSVFGAKRIVEGFLKGKVVVTNIHLVEGWEKLILRHSPYYKVAKAEKKEFYEREIRSRYAYVPDMDVLVGAKIYGRGESRGIRVIDEAHNEVNNREFMATEQKKILRKVSLSRKRGWDDYIIAQNKDNTDAALRRISAVEVRCINWKKILVLPYFHTELLPFHFFLAIARHLNVDKSVKSEDQKLWSRVYFLGWEANVFDTFEDFDTPDEIESPHETLWLPRPIDSPYIHEEFIAKRDAARKAASQEKEETEVTTSAASRNGSSTPARLTWPPAPRNPE